MYSGDFIRKSVIDDEVKNGIKRLQTKMKELNQQKTEAVKIEDYMTAMKLKKELEVLSEELFKMENQTNVNLIGFCLSDWLDNMAEYLHPLSLDLKYQINSEEELRHLDLYLGFYLSLIEKSTNRYLKLAFLQAIEHICSQFSFSLLEKKGFSHQFENDVFAILQNVIKKVELLYEQGDKDVLFLLSLLYSRMCLEGKGLAFLKKRVITKAIEELHENVNLECLLCFLRTSYFHGDVDVVREFQEESGSTLMAYLSEPIDNLDIIKDILDKHVIQSENLEYVNDKIFPFLLQKIKKNDVVFGIIAVRTLKMLINPDYEFSEHAFIKDNETFGNSIKRLLDSQTELIAEVLRLCVESIGECKVGCRNTIIDVFEDNLTTVSAMKDLMNGMIWPSFPRWFDNEKLVYYSTGFLWRTPINPICNVINRTNNIIKIEEDNKLKLVLFKGALQIFDLFPLPEFHYGNDFIGKEIINAIDEISLESCLAVKRLFIEDPQSRLKIINAFINCISEDIEENSLKTYLLFIKNLFLIWLKLGVTNTSQRKFIKLKAKIEMNCLFIFFSKLNEQIFELCFDLLNSFRELTKTFSANNEISFEDMFVNSSNYKKVNSLCQVIFGKNDPTDKDLTSFKTLSGNHKSIYLNILIDKASENFVNLEILNKIAPKFKVCVAEHVLLLVCLLKYPGSSWINKSDIINSIFKLEILKNNPIVSYLIALNSTRELMNEVFINFKQFLVLRLEETFQFFKLLFQNKIFIDWFLENNEEILKCICIDNILIETESESYFQFLNCVVLLLLKINENKFYRKIFQFLKSKGFKGEIMQTCLAFPDIVEINKQVLDLALDLVIYYNLGLLGIQKS
ncbi:hypothetical protein ROZALSC1DRAFT_28654 [Rozella allomycis CSF55]|uniref:Uncharacterized protein n=1 Tax=Rozella allomycis (strain CSF55) TaxID=988480 RepID=A0A4P9YK28_ROZAC|nr:hypothetical protein ROZALSC1DRAFT_28654 [Rozella allomycis CSF55]